MEPSQVAALATGDIVQHRPSGEGYVVVMNTGRAVHAVRSITVSNPTEWGMSRGQIESLRPGQIVRHFLGREYVVAGSNLAVLHRNVSEAPEDWTLIRGERS